MSTGVWTSFSGPTEPLDLRSSDGTPKTWGPGLRSLTFRDMSTTPNTRQSKQHARPFPGLEKCSTDSGPRARRPVHWTAVASAERQHRTPSVSGIRGVQNNGLGADLIIATVSANGRALRGATSGRCRETALPIPLGNLGCSRQGRDAIERVKGRGT